jgi:hypothetical protein
MRIDHFLFIKNNSLLIIKVRNSIFYRIFNLQFHTKNELIIIDKKQILYLGLSSINWRKPDCSSSSCMTKRYALREDLLAGRSGTAAVPAKNNR